MKKRVDKKWFRTIQIVMLGIFVCFMITGCSKTTPKKAFADIEIEGYGTITVELDGESAPETVANFIKLSEEGFYDGLIFHRVMKIFL